MSILAEILEHKRIEVERLKRERPLGQLEKMAAAAGAARGFRRKLARPEGQPVRAIAEIKRASPSAGPIRPGADPAEIARQYAGAGATCISVLTDEHYFDGRLAFLGQVRKAVKLPLLRKDFILSPYQLVEARAAGADAALLIVSALSEALLRELLSVARDLAMDALVEIHSEAEAETALAAGANLIGVNHRDLATFEIDMSLTGRLRAHVPSGTVLVGESGIRCADDVRQLGEAGADAVLVGEHLMRAERPGDALASLLEGA